MNKFKTLFIIFFGLFCWSSGILLFDKSKSFAVYDVWNITAVGKMELKFKTNSKYCTLLYVDNQVFSQYGRPLNTNINSKNGDSSKRDESYFEIVLIQGRLKVTHQILTNENRERFTIGENLNNLKWHKLTITKYIESLRIEVDGTSHMITFSENIAKKFRIESRLYVGGLSENKISSSYGTAKKIPRFFGCIEGLRYSSGSLDMLPAYHMLKGESVATECLNTCGINPCQNGGVCVNYFTRAGCDCSRTGYEEDRCTKPAESLNVGDKDYLKWPQRDDFNSMKFRFKTLKSNGIIFFTKRGGNMFIAELIDGQLRVAARKITDVSKEVIIKKNLFDAKWHSVIVLRSGNVISVTVDKESPVNFTTNIGTTKSSETRNSKPVYFGGIEHPKHMFGTDAKQNFEGCLQQIFYNAVDVIYRVQRTNVIVKVGRVKNGCPFKNIKIPTQKPTTEKTVNVIPYQPEIKEKVTLIKEIHTRESGMGQNVIIWITTAIVIGTIIILISAACVVHHVRMKYYRTQSKSNVSDDDDDDDNIPMHKTPKEHPEEKSNESSRAGTPTIDEGEKMLKCKESDEYNDLTKDSESGV